MKAIKPFRVDVLNGETVQFRMVLPPADFAWWYEATSPMQCTEVQVRLGRRRINTIRIETEWKFAGIGHISGDSGRSAIFMWGACIRSERLFPPWIDF